MAAKYGKQWRIEMAAASSKIIENKHRNQQAWRISGINVIIIGISMA